MRRRAYRESLGCIEIPLPEAKVLVPHSDLDASRPRVGITRLSQWESPSRALVAEMMILAGEVAGIIGGCVLLGMPSSGLPSGRLPLTACSGAHGVTKLPLLQ